jgi:hypothetical protein
MSESAKITNSDPIDKREQIRSQLEATRSAFNSLLDQLTIEDLNKPSLNPAWTIGELLYHMSFAPRNLPSDVWLIRHLNWVPKIPAGTFNKLNTYLTRRGGRNATKKMLAESYDEAHQRTLKALESIRDDEWEKGVKYPDWDPMLNGYVTLERLFQYIGLHFESHAGDIKGALKLKDVPG